jgi:hypothetical protein
MVNHIRTLWVNMTAAQQLPFTSAYVEPDFAPITLTPALARVDALLFPAAADARIKLAEDLCFICDGNELNPYLHRFDSRSQYSRLQASLSTIITTPASALTTAALRRVIADPQLPVTAKTLFKDPTYQDDMDTLFSLWTHPCEGVMRLCSLALAYGYNLDAIRRGRV